ncbi:MAG: toll/interleukin-1 receptor domain-containing protein [Candidatus Thiodiazotropha sp.]
MKKPTVFISYSYTDWDMVSQILKALDQRNTKYWSDQRIAPGEEWQKEIETAIQSADIFILMVSPGFASSDFAMYETGQAVGISQVTGAKIIPVLIKEGVLPSVLNRYQILDARSMSPNETASRIEQIINQINA